MGLCAGEEGSINDYNNNELDATDENLNNNNKMKNSQRIIIHNNAGIIECKINHKITHKTIPFLLPANTFVESEKYLCC